MECCIYWSCILKVKGQIPHCQQSCILICAYTHTHTHKQVVATDGGSPPLSSNTSIIVTVTDINDNPPEFTNSSYSFQLPENEPLGTVIGQFVAEDRDAGPAANLTFSVTGPFAER